MNRLFKGTNDEKKKARCVMHKLIREEDGNILVLTAASVFLILILAASAIDVSYILTARNQLQCAVDASALAGATGLIVNNQEAVDRAIQFAGLNNCVNNPVQVNSGDVSFPSSNQIRVNKNLNLNLFFAPVCGLNSVSISAQATAQVNNIIGTDKVRPLAVPDKDFNVGDPFFFKPGKLGDDPLLSDFYYPVRFPPGGGLMSYTRNLRYGYNSDVYIGDAFGFETSIVKCITANLIGRFISQDPTAYWDGSKVVGSAYPGYSSPRILKIVIYDPIDPPTEEDPEINVVGLAAFFFELGSCHELIGRYIKITTTGVVGDGYTYLTTTALVL